MTMLARQEEYYEEEQRVLTPEEEEKELRKAPKEPLFKTVLALLVTVGSGISASRGYELVAIQQQAEQKEQENERLKIEIAKLKSPDRIKAIAKDQLGMEVPRQTYFSSEK